VLFQEIEFKLSIISTEISIACPKVTQQNQKFPLSVHTIKCPLPGSSVAARFFLKFLSNLVLSLNDRFNKGKDHK
jgi:hypothetical protein